MSTLPGGLLGSGDLAALSIPPEVLVSVLKFVDVHEAGRADVERTRYAAAGVQGRLVQKEAQALGERIRRAEADRRKAESELAELEQFRLASAQARSDTAGVLEAAYAGAERSSQDLPMLKKAVEAFCTRLGELAAPSGVTPFDDTPVDTEVSGARRGEYVENVLKPLHQVLCAIDQRELALSRLVSKMEDVGRIWHSHFASAEQSLHELLEFERVLNEQWFEAADAERGAKLDFEQAVQQQQILKSEVDGLRTRRSEEHETHQAAQLGVAEELSAVAAKEKDVKAELEGLSQRHARQQNKRTGLQREVVQVRRRAAEASRALRQLRESRSERRQRQAHEAERRRSARRMALVGELATVRSELLRTKQQATQTQLRVHVLEAQSERLALNVEEEGPGATQAEEESLREELRAVEEELRTVRASRDALQVWLSGRRGQAEVAPEPEPERGHTTDPAPERPSLLEPAATTRKVDRAALLELADAVLESDDEDDSEFGF
jgi:hypothetical protein